MNLSELCIRRPVMVVLLSISLILVGILAYSHIPVAALQSMTAVTSTVLLLGLVATSVWRQRLRIRYEIRADLHLGLLQLACALVCYRQLPEAL